MTAWVSILVALVVAVPAAADLLLPPGYVAETYVTGKGFDGGSERSAQGIPSTSSLAFDRSGVLYLAKTGARFRQGDVDDLYSLYRIPVGGARLTPDTEARFFHGPPLRNPQVAAIGLRGEIFISTYDRDRQIGALYRMIDGRPQLFAGGTPLDGSPPLLRHPEGAAVDPVGNVYVADRERGVVVQLDPAGKVLNPRYLSVTRARMLAFDAEGHLWIGSDGSAETPFQEGTGQIWRMPTDGAPSLVLQGPLPAGMGMGPGGTLHVAQRRTGKVFVLAPDGMRLDFSGAAEGTFLRGLAFAPDTPETRRAGIAGDLFVIVVRRQIWPVNEVLRIIRK